METENNKSENHTFAGSIYALSLETVSWLMNFLYFDLIHKAIGRKLTLG